MRDFPVFTTQYGVASLVLKEVPYKQEAYIVIQASEQPEEHLAECVSFCRMVGAEKVFARGHEVVEKYPLYNMIYEMRGEIACDGASNSEIVIPLIKEGVLIGVLDIDSPVVGRFDAEDQRGLEKLAGQLVAGCDW